MDLPIRRTPDRSAARRAAALSIVSLGLVGGFLGGRHLRPPVKLPLPPALDGDIETLSLPFGTLSYYRGGKADAAPLLLIHSVNASANAYEMKPLYDHYAESRAVYAIDLPGFGFSDRPDRIYTPRLMTDAILALVEEIRRRHGNFPLDAIAVSLSSEFLARAATEHPTMFRSIGLVSPSGLQAARSGDGDAGSNYGRPAVRDVISFPAWGRGLFDLLVSRVSIRYYLSKTWGSWRIDDGLAAYDYRSAHQPGAEHAPFSFLSGFLFSADIMTVYKALTVPVFMTHGVRGDFVDYMRKAEVEGRPNWTVRVFQTGALSYFERLDEFAEAYGAFHDRAA
ncbi:alpha/beta fold hydrolase [Beijerinckia sp. L45]|uniref:alpha/beta fold hydrolase n=1 Tax=Beijerinckia sp. L45 TaxID=1641855 RepID=UPI00131EC31D|nr:alpha/beta hydrolase [Beijerinckia sp. L45]